MFSGDEFWGESLDEFPAVDVVSHSQSGNAQEQGKDNP